MKIEIDFEGLPLWQGVRDAPGRIERYPFRLGWNEAGYIYQQRQPGVTEKITEAYAKEEYAFITQPPGASEWANLLGDAYANFIQTRCTFLGPSTSVLEIGAGSIHLAERLVSQKGISEYWIMDPAVKEKSRFENIHVRREYFHEGTSPDRQFDLVIGLNCLEHMPDPRAFLLTLRKTVKPGSGKAVLVFPDNERQLREGDFNGILHEHISYHTLKSCENLFDSAGFRIVEADSKADTFSFLLELGGEPRSETFPMDGVLATAARAFYSNYRYVAESLASSLERNETIAIHGATNGLNNILALIGRDSDPRLQVYDGDITKAGKFVPACPTPIRHSEDDGYKEAEKVFIAAMSYYDDIRTFIRQRHQIPDSSIHPLFPASAGGSR